MGMGEEVPGGKVHDRDGLLYWRLAHFPGGLEDTLSHGIDALSIARAAAQAQYTHNLCKTAKSQPQRVPAIFNQS